jgi:hypothetical protein
MRDSGAIPLVGTNTPELCMMIETYNKINGTTNNPYDLRRTPSGSSGGEVRDHYFFNPRLFTKQYFSYKKIQSDVRQPDCTTIQLGTCYKHVLHSLKITC